MNRYLYLLVLLMMSAVAKAQHVSCNAPRNVEVGSKFQIEYTIEASDVSSFELGKLPEGVNILYGPSHSTMSSYQYVNGHMSGSTTVTVSYIVMATQSGNITFPPAHIVANGRRISSGSLHVHATGGSKTPSASTTHAVPQQGGKTVGNNGTSDLFIRVSSNKTRVHEQEPVMLTYKLYTTVDLTQMNGAMPDLKGFHTQEVKLPQQKTFRREVLNGKTYQTVTWSQYIMYPQMTGRLTIPPITYHGIVMEENRDEDPMEAFITGGGYREVKRDVTAPGITIQVDPLPAKPKNFSGGVGHFNISSQLAKTDVKTGDPINLRVVLGGNGNLKLVKEPVVQLPDNIDKYDTKITDKTTLSEHGVEGNMIYDYLFVARKEGKYTIPAIRFIYYDTSANAYRTITTQSYTVNVSKGNGNADISDFTGKDSQDIRGLRTGACETHRIDDFFYGSLFYWIILAVLFVVFAVLLYTFRKTALERADIVGMRRNNASKIAAKRMRRANSLMQKDRADEFYDEVLHALWGYLGDKLSMPVEELNRDNISDKLAGLNVDDATIAKFIGALDECEFERFAPGDPKGNMDKTMDSAITAIMGIEDAIKAGKKTAETAHPNSNKTE